MASMDDVKVGKRILVDGQPYEVIKSEHLKVAMGKGMEKCMLVNLLTGKTIPMTFHAVDKVEAADIQLRDADYQYFDGHSYHFMDIQNYESYFINADVIGDRKYFLVDGTKTTVMFWDGNPINVQIDPSVTLEVTDTPPGEKGNSASNNLKPATLNTGLEIKVPLFIGQGEKIRVDSRTYEYLGRDNS